MFGRLVRSVFGNAGAGPSAGMPARDTSRQASARLEDILSIPSVPLRALFEDRYYRELPERDVLTAQTQAAHAAAFEGDPLPIAIELLVRAPIMRMLVNRGNTAELRRLGVAFDGALDAARRAAIACHGEVLPIAEARLPLALQSVGLLVAQGVSDPYWGPGQWLIPTIRAAAHRGDPASRQALVAMFASFFAGEPHRHDAMIKLVETLLPASNLPRDAIPALGAVDARARKLDAVRDAVLREAGEGLALAVAAVLDCRTDVCTRTLRDAEKNEALRALAALSPAERGETFHRMLRLIAAQPRFGIERWGEMERPNGRYQKLVNPQTHLVGFGNILGVLASRKIDLVDADNDIADFLGIIPYFHHLGYKRILDLVLETARAHPHGRTVAALRVMATPAGSNHPFRDSIAAIEDVLRDLPAASAASMTPATAAAVSRAKPAVPVTGFGRKGVASAPSAQIPQSAIRGLPPVALPEVTINDWRAPDQISSHFDNLFEARLYDAAHRDFLARLAALSDDIAPTAGQERREQCRAIATMAISRGFVPSGDTDPTRLANNIERTALLGAELNQRFSAFAPFVMHNAEKARALGKLASELAEKSTPTAKWLDAGRALFADISHDTRMTMIDALTGAPTPTSQRGANEAHLRALLFLSSDLAPASLGPALADFALRRCYVTLPNIGIRAEKLGNACLWTLAAMPDGAGVPYLARVLARTKYPKIKARIDAKLNEAAEAAGISRATLDELTVPTHELDRDGTRSVALGDGTATLRIVDGRSAEIQWIAASGKTLKSSSVAMKADAEALKELRQAAKELDADLAIQPARLQRLYIEDRRWPVAEWRERYLDHPLMSGLTCRLVWWVDTQEGRSVAAMPDGDALCDVAGRPVDADGATIRLWHPIEALPADVEAWRDRLEALELTQPFAQIWREVYALTDAERTTGTYSNRWAAHILKQHQAMTLARLNGWRVTHRMWVDAANDTPWHLTIPAHGLVVDYWVEGAGGDDPEVSESGAYSYVTTDRLQFHSVAPTRRTARAGRRGARR